MSELFCPQGHRTSVDARVCLTCGWVFPLPDGTTSGGWRVVESVRRHDRYFYRVEKAGESAVIAETLEYFPEEFRERLYRDLASLLTELQQPILDYAYWRSGQLVFLHTRYPASLWTAVQNPLRDLLDRQGVLDPQDITALFERLESACSLLKSSGLMNPSFTSLLTGPDELNRWVFLEWEYCVSEEGTQLYPRSFLGYHRPREQQEPRAYLFQLMRSALRALTLEALTGMSPVDFYPEAVSIQSCRMFLSPEFRRWLQHFEQAEDPREFKPVRSYFASQAGFETLRAANLNFFQAGELFRQKNFSQALGLFQQAAQNHVLFSQAFRYQALCLRDLDYTLALHMSAQALRCEARACFYYERAESHVAMGNLADAAEDLLQAIEISHYYPEAWYLLGTVREKLNHFHLAESAYLTACEQLRNPAYQQALARLFEKQGLFEQARKYRSGTLASGGRISLTTEEVLPPEQVYCPEGHANAPERGVCLLCEAPLGLVPGQWFQDYQVLEQLKRRDPISESFTSVYKVCRDGSEFLLKEYFVPLRKRDDFVHKYQELAQLKHPYIQNVQDVFVVAPYGYLVYPWRSGQTLQNYLEHRGATPEKMAWQILITISAVILYLQSQPSRWVHGDIKPDNILLTDTGDILLFDLDSSVALYSAHSVYQAVSTFPYSPPEQLEKHQVNLTSDAYALGVTLIAALTGVFPELFLSYSRKTFDKWEQRIPHVSTNLKTCVQNLIAWNDRDRMVLDQTFLKKALQTFKQNDFLPPPIPFLAFQEAFWGLYRARPEQLDSGIKHLLQQETSRLTLYFSASRCYQAEQYTQALHLLRNIRSFGGNYEPQLWLLAELYLKTGSPALAVEVLNQSLDSYHEHFWPYVLLGRAWLELDKERLAFAAYEQAQKQRAPIPFLLEFIAVLLEHAFFQEVVVRGRQYLPRMELPYDRAFVQGAIGMALSQLMRDEEALTHLKESLELQPQQTRILFEAGKVCLRLKKHSEAQVFFSHLLNLDPRQRAARFYWACTEIELKHFESALRVLVSLEQAVESPREYLELSFQKSRVLTLLGRFEEAIMCYEKLLVSHPCEAVCVNFGNLCLIVEDYAKAEQLFRQALTFFPDSKPAKNGLQIACSATSA